ncbi:MAG: hypothetical protein ACXQTJ_06765 [Candidatus Syntropharchaeales archaeon]
MKFVIVEWNVGDFGERESIYRIIGSFDSEEDARQYGTSRYKGMNWDRYHSVVEVQDLVYNCNTCSDTGIIELYVHPFFGFKTKTIKCPDCKP